MFTTIDLANAKNTISHKRGENQLYTPQKSELSFDLFGMSSLDRGTCLEIMIVEHMKSLGIDTTHMGGSNSANDLVIFAGGKIIRGECKSSLLGPTSGKYYFQGVKPECFDILFFTFVNPTDGVVVKTAGKKDIMAWVETYSPKRKREGFDIYFRSDMVNDKIPTVEWDPSGEGVVRV
jgi:hypothetical protein